MSGSPGRVRRRGGVTGPVRRVGSTLHRAETSGFAVLKGGLPLPRLVGPTTIISAELPGCARPPGSLAAGCLRFAPALPDHPDHCWAGRSPPESGAPCRTDLPRVNGFARTRLSQVRTRTSATQPRHLPPGLKRRASLCCASSPHPAGLACRSCSLAHGCPIAFLRTAGHPPALGFW